MMYIDNEVLEKMIMTIVEGFDRIEKKLDRMGRVKEFLNGDELLDNYDIARLLNVSLRTVARYREKGLIRYYQTDENGKNFYRVSDNTPEFFIQRDMEYFDKAFEQAADGKGEVSLSLIGGALKKMMPKFKVRRYGCKTLGKLYERLDRYELVMTDKGVASAVRLKD